MIRYLVYLVVISMLAYAILKTDRNPAVTAVNMALVSAGVFLVGESIARAPCGPPNLDLYK